MSFTVYEFDNTAMVETRIMTPQEAKKKIEQLTQEINNYNEEYYNLGQSSINDDEYDILINQLSDLEKTYPDYAHPDSPTARVGGQPTEFFENVRHNHAMLSLSNLYNEQDLLDWVKRIQTGLDQKAFKAVCEVKIDGFAISIIYTDGEYSQAITRGNGEIGDDVTQNVKTIRNLPLTLPEKISLELRGEIFLTKERFEQINQQKSNSGTQTFKNPRNAAAGTIRMKNQKEVAQRGLNILIYDVVSGQPHENHSKNLDYLTTLGLPINSYRQVCNSAEEVFEFCNQWQKDKETLSFEIDGVVIKLESLPERELLGFTAKSPRWATAWKFKAEKVTSIINEIENSIGRTGILTPVANLEPVQLLGTEVKRATLHNYDQISKLDIRLGDTVFVEKGGDIIPKIVGVDYTKRLDQAEPITPPTNCPKCESTLLKPDGEIDLRCENESCPAILQGTLEHFVSKKGMDIQYLGNANIETFIQKGFIGNIVDIFKLATHKSELLKMEGFGEKSVDNLLSAIEESKKIPINQFIFALGIRHIGEKAAKVIATKVKSLEDFAALDHSTLEALPDFGPIMIDSLVNWLSKESSIATLKKLQETGLTPTPVELNEDQPFAGKTIVLTGTLTVPRNQWKLKLERAGFNVASSVSKKTDYLLAGEKAGSKLKKAKELGVVVVSEDQISQLLGE